MSRYLLANWKSNKTRIEVQQWLQQFATDLDAQTQAALQQTETTVVIAPSFPFVTLVTDAITEYRWEQVALGVQTVSPYPAGKYTGGVSTYNLQGLGVEFAVLGHSEERRYFHVTSQEVAQKVELCLDADIVPVVCVDTPYLQEQVQALSSESLSQIIVAYEPLEAIGTGDNQPVVEVAEVVKRIRALFGSVPVLYGGSASDANIQEYLTVVDGAIIGTESLDPNHFFRLVKAACSK